MQKIDFRGYRFYISPSLLTLVNENENKFLVIHPDGNSICAACTVFDDGSLQCDAFWGIGYEMKGKTLLIYDRGDQLDDELQDLFL